MKAKIGSQESEVEIEKKYGLKLLHLNMEGMDQGTVIRFSGKNVAYVHAYSSDWLEGASRIQLYEELISQLGSGRCEYSGEELKAYSTYLCGCYEYDKKMDPKKFQKHLDKQRLMEDLK